MPLLSAGQVAGQPKDAVRRRLFVDGTPIPANRIVVRDGVEFVDVSALAEAMGAKVKSTDASVQVTSSAAKSECVKAANEGRRFSPEFRTDVLSVPDEIESLRAVAFKKDVDPSLGPKFDEIDKKLTYSQTHVLTDADQAVYYALAYASNSLGIAYYQRVRGVPVEEAQKNQLESVMCSMESKFALMKGILIPGGNCTVFKRIESQQPIPKVEDSSKPE
jgi:hypothetical protein